MAAYQGTYYAIALTLKSAADDSPINVTGWTLEADVKRDRKDEAALLTMTTENGSFAIIDGAAGRLEFRLTAEQTALLPVGKLVYDVLRTDADPGPRYVFGGSFRVKTPVTR
jgi:hypothetical protein